MRFSRRTFLIVALALIPACGNPPDRKVDPDAFKREVRDFQKNRQKESRPVPYGD